MHGPVTHEFPYEGTDEERVMYTRRLNDLLRNACLQRGYTYLDVHSLYARDDGTFRYEDSDGICHIYRNEAVLRAFDQALRPLPVQSHPPLGTTAPPPPPSTVRTTARHLPPPRTARRRMGAQRVVAAAPPLLRRAAAAAAPVGRGRGRGRSVAVGIGRRSLGAPPSL